MLSHTPTANPFLGIPLPSEHDTFSPVNINPVDILDEAFAGLRAQSALSITTNHVTQVTFRDIVAQSFAGPSMEPAPEQLDLTFTQAQQEQACMTLVLSHIDSPLAMQWAFPPMFTKEHYLGGQWWISWPRFVWEIHQKFDDPDLKKKAAVAAKKLTMQAGKGEEYFQELERLLNDAKYDWENQVVHCWITTAIPKEIYSSVHQAFVAATVNDKLQQGYNVQIPEDYESWKTAILHTDNAMRRLQDEEKLRNHDRKEYKVSDKGKERAQQDRPCTEPTDEQCANLLKRKCNSCRKT
ncbi:hypothetical protein WOLCODRAFT_155569 [Wolfiporia cocos MD-104 SS10]|uniref:Retrotransposon gag domain-containing protein n=1 Tax=Wolfiporia cocos (strain MD-104) TaxID=742152 RepID=A0A2H3IY76_WOLCO|nr:hypothetical protein WOLCODRAFT_155569 [Wolfiporia cocos MD-104 SS10]